MYKSLNLTLNFERFLFSLLDVFLCLNWSWTWYFDWIAERAEGDEYQQIDLR